MWSLELGNDVVCLAMRRRLGLGDLVTGTVGTEFGNDLVLKV